MARRWLLTALATVVALYLVLGSCLAWLDAARNQARGGREFIGEVAFDVLMASIAPAVFVLVLRIGRGVESRLVRYRAACGYGSMAGMVTFLLRSFASGGF